MNSTILSLRCAVRPDFQIVERDRGRDERLR
jgi:hypothetical protein